MYSKNASVISEKLVSSFWRALSSFRPPVSSFCASSRASSTRSSRFPRACARVVCEREPELCTFHPHPSRRIFCFVKNDHYWRGKSSKCHRKIRESALRLPSTPAPVVVYDGGRRFGRVLAVDPGRVRDLAARLARCRRTAASPSRWGTSRACPRRLPPAPVVDYDGGRCRGSAGSCRLRHQRSRGGRTVPQNLSSVLIHGRARRADLLLRPAAAADPRPLRAQAGRSMPSASSRRPAAFRRRSCEPERGATRSSRRLSPTPTPTPTRRSRRWRRRRRTARTAASIAILAHSAARARPARSTWAIRSAKGRTTTGRSEKATPRTRSPARSGPGERANGQHAVP